MTEERWLTHVLAISSLQAKKNFVTLFSIQSVNETTGPLVPGTSAVEKVSTLHHPCPCSTKKPVLGGNTN